MCLEVCGLVESELGLIYTASTTQQWRLRLEFQRDCLDWLTHDSGITMRASLLGTGSRFEETACQYEAHCSSLRPPYLYHRRRGTRSASPSLVDIFWIMIAR